MNEIVNHVAGLPLEEKQQLLTQLMKGLQLSHSEREVWIQYQSVATPIHVVAAFDLRGTLDVVLLQQSFNGILARHENLRSTFIELERVPIRIISPAMPLVLSVVDVQELPKMAQEKEQRRLTTEQSQRPFDLTRGPLLRATLIRKEEQVHVLLLTIHHIICDGWSFGVLMRELATLYDVFSAGMPSPLSQLSIQYADFAIWQREWLQGRVLEEQLAYWKRNLTGMPTILALPTDRPRPPVQTYRGATFSFFLPLALGEHLKALCQREEATLFMGLLAAWQTLLYRYSSQENFAVGSPIANRSRPELEGLIGFFANTLVLRADLSGNPTFRELVHRTREVCLGAYAYQDVPFEKLVEELRPERDASHSPLFQVMFVLQNAPRPVVELPGLTLTPLEVETGTTRFDLTLTVTETRQGLKGSLEYNTDLYDGVTIERMGEHFQVLLESVVADAEQRISDLPLLREDERRLVLEEWAHGPREAVPRVCLHELFESQVERTPEAVAVVFEDKAVTYRELNHRANQLAQYLLQLGVGPDVLVGICVERSVEMVVGLLGILKAGGAYVPLDPAYPKERLAFMLADSNASVLLTEERWLERFPKHRAQVVCLDRDWLTIAARSPDKPPSHVCPDNLAYVIYTSGSTGKPKGTLIDHRGVVNYLIWCERAYPIAVGQGSPVHSSISFDLTVTSLFTPLLVGRQAHLLPEDFGVDQLSAALRNGTDYSLVKITPTHLSLLSQQLSPREAWGRTHAFIIGGENLLAEHITFWQEHSPDTVLVNEYGPTETVVGCCVYEMPLHRRADGPVPIGRPIFNTELYILDTHLQPVPVRVSGELYIGGLGLARGYLNHADLTAERFIPNPFTNQTGARLYKTGDLARYLSDGNIEFLGRLDDQIKLRGYRIEPGEIEAIVLQLPEIAQATVLVREDAFGGKRLIAYLVPRNKETLSRRELRAFLKEKLPDYMVPQLILFLDELPRTPNGKVDQRALSVFEAPPSGSGTDFAAFRTPLERDIALAFASVLGVNKVGLNSDFFDLGGDSLLATQLGVCLSKKYGIRLQVSAMFRVPTVAGVARVIEVYQREGDNGVSNLNKMQIDEDISLDPGVIPQWLATENEVDVSVAAPKQGKCAT